MEYPIGTMYRSSGRHPRCCTVIDVWRTYNTQGDLVRTRYVTTHEIMGQIVTEHDVLGITIAKGLMGRQGK